MEEKYNFTNSNTKYLREQKHISQENLSNELDIDQSTLAKWESSTRQITLEWAIKIADYFNVNIGDFIEKDLRIENNNFNKTQVLFDKYDRLSEDDKKFIETYIIEKDKQIDKQNNDF